MDNQLLSMAEQFSGLPMESLIGAPLNAAAKANAAMAATQTSFLLDTCFNYVDGENGEGKVYKPIMINMELTRAVLTESFDNENNGTVVKEEFTTSFNLPILTILPLNSLAVQSAEVKFDMEVKSSFSENIASSKDSNLEGEGSFSASIGVGPFTATVSGSVSYSQSESSSREQHYEKSNSANYSIDVKAGQIPLPQGVTTIIDAFTKAIEPIVIPVKTDPANQ